MEPAATAYFGFLSRLIPFDWNYHALLMLGTWFGLVPVGIVAIRFGKPRPRPHGIREEIKLTNDNTIARYSPNLCTLNHHHALLVSLISSRIPCGRGRGLPNRIATMPTGTRTNQVPSMRRA